MRFLTRRKKKHRKIRKLIDDHKRAVDNFEKTADEFIATINGDLYWMNLEKLRDALEECKDDSCRRRAIDIFSDTVNQRR